MRNFLLLLASCSAYGAVSFVQTTTMSGPAIEMLRVAPQMQSNVELQQLIQGQNCTVKIQKQQLLADCGVQKSLLNLESGKVLVLDTAKKTYQESSVSEIAAAIEQVFKRFDQSPSGVAPKIEFKETGEIRELQGYSCRVTSGQMDVEVAVPEVPELKQHPRAHMELESCEGQGLPAENELTALTKDAMQAMGLGSNSLVGMAAPFLGPNGGPALQQLRQAVQKFTGMPLFTKVHVRMELPGLPEELQNKMQFEMQQTLMDFKAEPYLDTDLKIPDGYTPAPKPNPAQ